MNTPESQFETGGPAASRAAEAGPAGPGAAPPRPPLPVGPPPGPYAGRDPRAKSPGFACLLSAVPGLGQVYVGYYQRGFVHALVVAGIISGLAADVFGELTPMFALFMAFFWLYNIIDAGRRASFYNQALAGNEVVEPPAEFGMPGLGGSIAGGVVLMGVGFILLLHTRFDVSFAWVEEWWPMAPILFGAFLLIKAIQERSGAPSDRPGPSAGP